MFKPIFLITLVTVSLSISQNKNPMWDTEADFRNYEPKILELIDKIQNDPLGADVDKMSFIVNSWATGTPYIGFTRYKKYISEIDKDYPYYATLFNAYSFGEMDLKLRNKKDYNELEIASASLKSMLNAYLKIIESDPNSHNKVLDQYIELDKGGTLMKHFESIKISGSVINSKELPAYYVEFEYGIKIKNMEDEKIKFKEWKKKDLLVLYVSAACPHCRDLAKKMSDSIKSKVEVILLFSRINSSGQIKEFFENTKVGFKAYYDYDAQFAKEYGGGIVPVSILIKKDGSAIRAAGGDQQKIQDIIEESNKL